MAKRDIQDVIDRARAHLRQQRATIVGDAASASAAWAARGRAMPTPGNRWRLPRPQPSPSPPSPQTFVLTMPDHLEPGAGCAPTTAGPNVVGMSGERKSSTSLWAQAAPPNGDDALVWFTFDPPDVGFIYVTTSVNVYGTVQGQIGPGGSPDDYYGYHFHFGLNAVCTAYQVDHGHAAFPAYRIDSPVIHDRRALALQGYALTETFHGAAYTPPPLLIGVEPSSASVPPVAIGVGAAIAMSIEGDHVSLQWDFCPGIAVPSVVIDFVPASSVVVG